MSDHKSWTPLRTPDPLVKVNSTLSLSASTLLHRLVLLSVCFIYPMSGRYSTNWDRKVDPARKFKCTTATRALTDLPHIWIGDLGKPTGMFLAWFLHFKFSGSTFTVKNSKNRDLRPSAGNLWVTWARLYNNFILKEMDRVWIVFLQIFSVRIKL